ncbi:phosphatase PAP2 family protein [Paenarthrobacter sp. Z7-10]|uniref:phosphatase PAP2 family protein n=1 Tax=Paenarthrobacter sp. Z7-10 TaxID=2787635 RepID=UPI0022A9DEBB|nr:phosphatase PAP2 family protein [Paenarthrobacter sp. Z7-10]MCZ2403171.1 phosphatase PAP2 family protein [Paenarthrobacter sp. Z7-10]
MKRNGSVDRPKHAGWHQKFIVEERRLPAAARRRLYLTSTVLMAVRLLGFLILLAAVLTYTGFERLDQPVENWFDAQRAPSTTGFMIALAIIFGPIALPIIVLVVTVSWTILAKHAWRPLLLAAAMLLGVILAEILAPLVKHPRPPIDLMLFGPDTSFSFPSGHVLGTSDFLLMLALLIASRRQKTVFTFAAVALAVLGIFAQVVSRLYLGYHWISDTSASIALSMVIVGAVIAVDTKRTVRIHGEPVSGPLSQPQVDGT